MAYISRAQVQALISIPDLTNFLDDDGSGSETVGKFDDTVSMASVMVDSFLAGIYPTPFAPPVPALIQNATLIFFAEMVYAKRLTPNEVNPFKDRADTMREILNSIRKDGTGLDFNIDRSFTPGFAIVDSMAFNGTTS